MKPLYDLFWHVISALMDISIDIETEYLLFNGYDKPEAADRNDSRVFQSS
jgi:hypothetical protein